MSLFGPRLAFLAYWLLPYEQLKITAALVDKLLENGYTKEDCGKFFGGNLYRVFQKVWK